ncbi:hypothetical protein Hanom_Chr10g00952581 [Helianthus anomalus]
MMNQHKIHRNRVQKLSRTYETLYYQIRKARIIQIFTDAFTQTVGVQLTK